MRERPTVFISHAFQDNERCRPLLAALASWEVDSWFQERRDEADEALSRRVEREIEEREVFIRVCSLDADRSHWVRLETEAFRRLQAEEGARSESPTRRMIVARFDSGPEPHGMARGDVFIGEIGLPDCDWRAELRRALGLDDPADEPGDEAPATESEDASEDAGSETSKLPRVTQQAALERLHTLVTQLAQREPEDSVVSVAIADRADAAASDSKNAATSRYAALEVVGGAEAGPKYHLVKPLVTLGRSLDRDIVLHDARASRRHATIERDERGRYVLRDEGSTNGTFVNERPVIERELADGDLIRVGKTAFRLRLPHRDD